MPGRRGLWSLCSGSLMKFNRRIFMLSSVSHTHTFKQTSSSPDLPAVSQRQIQAYARSRRGRCSHPELGLRIGTDGFDGRVCMLFASIKKRPSVTKGQAVREAFVHSTSYEQKLLRVDPARQCI